VFPTDELAPYDMALKDAGRPERRKWTVRVLASIDERVHPVPGDVFEIHAGAEYRDFGLLDGLLARGCLFENPTEGMRIGHQLRFYKEASGT
jgi:hypothetical protein